MNQRAWAWGRAGAANQAATCPVLLGPNRAVQGTKAQPVKVDLHHRLNDHSSKSPRYYPVGAARGAGQHAPAFWLPPSPAFIPGRPLHPKPIA